MGDLQRIKTVSLLRRSKTPIGIVGWAFAFVVLVGIVGLGSPIVTDGAITITSSGSGTGGIYIINDWVIVEWDNTGTGDGPQTISQVTADFTEFGGGGSIDASLFTGNNYEGKWQAQYQIVPGAIDDADNNVSVTAYNDAPHTTTADSLNLAVDNIQPTVTSVTVDTDPIYDGDLTQKVTLTYSEDMDELDTFQPTVQITGITTSKVDGHIAPVTGTWNSSTEYEVTFTLNDDNEEDSVLDIVVTSLEDLAGNIQISKTENNPFSVDTLNPTVVSITPSDTLISDADTGGGKTFTVTVVYDETMDATGANDPAIDFTPGVGTTLTFASDAWSTTTVTNDTYTATYNVADAGVEVDDVDIGVDGAKDLAGNSQVAGNNADAFDIDTKNPTITNLTVDTNPVYEGDLTQQVVVTFDEAMDTGTTPTIVFSHGTWTAGAGSWSAGDTVFTVTYTLTDNNEEFYDRTPGVDVVTVDVTGAKDKAGNVQEDYTPQTEFDIDTLQPTIADADSTTADGCYTTGATINVTLTFSEDVVLNADHLKLVLVTDGPRTHHVEIGSWGVLTNTATGTYTVVAGENSCDLTLLSYTTTVADTLLDWAGNVIDFQLPAAGSNIADHKDIVVDTTLPVAVNDPNGNEDRSSSDDIEVRVDDYGRYRLMVREDKPVWINVLFNDTDLPCTVLLRIHDIPQQPKYGTAMFNNPAGNIRYAPDWGQLGPDHFTYRIRDACGNISPEGTVYVAVIRQMAMDDVYITACTDTPKEFKVTATDLWIDPDDPDLISFTFDIVSAPVHGVLSGDLTDITYTLPGRTTKQMESASISLTYTPAAGFTGRDTITVRFADPFGGFSTAVVDIHVLDCVEPVEEIPPILVAQGDVLPMIVPLSFSSIYEAAWDTVTLVAEVDGATYVGALSAAWDETVGRFVLTLDTEPLPLGRYRMTIPLGNGETVTLTIEVGGAG